MKIGTRVVIVVRFGIRGDKIVCRARVMKTGKQNAPERHRVQIDDPAFKGTSWIIDEPDEEGVEWARGWHTTDAKALRAVTAMDD